MGPFRPGPWGRILGVPPREVFGAALSRLLTPFDAFWIFAPCLDLRRLFAAFLTISPPRATPTEKHPPLQSKPGTASPQAWLVVEDVDMAALDHRSQLVSPALLALGTGVVGNLPPRAVIPYPDVRVGWSPTRRGQAARWRLRPLTASPR